MKKKTILLSILILISFKIHSQITVKNNTKNPITNFYIIEYDSILKAPYCGQIFNENLIDKNLLAGKSVKLKYNLKTSSHYNIICFNATSPYYYENVCFKYFIPGQSKTLNIETKDVEEDFSECDLETDPKNGFTTVKFDFKNNTSSRIIKGYYKFSENEKYKKYSYFQLEPLFSGLSRTVKTSNTIPISVSKIFLKFYFENKGVITSKEYESDIKNIEKSNIFEIN